MGGDRQAQLEGSAVEVGGDRVRGVGRDADADPGGAGVLSALGEALEPGFDVAAEHLEIHDAAQAELRASQGRGPAVAGVAHRRDAGGEALRGAEERDRYVLVPADPRLALDVEPNPGPER